MTALSTEQIEALFYALASNMPSPRGELHYVNPYTLLVAVVLSAQATDISVNKATKPLFKRVTHPQSMLTLGEEGLKTYIRTIGLYNSKARNIITLSRRLIDNYDSHVPQTRSDLESLPGVGRKTANVVLNIAFGEPVIAVDTHVFRVANRTGLASGRTPIEVETQLEAIVPNCYRHHAHHWLILHGRYICKARKPMCYNCVINRVCIYPEKVLHTH